MYFSSDLSAYELRNGTEGELYSKREIDRQRCGERACDSRCIYTVEYNYRQISRYTVALGSKRGGRSRRVTLRALNKSR